MLAGISAVLSMATRRKSLAAMVRERSWKLLVSFAFGWLVIAIPCNIVIESCRFDVFSLAQLQGIWSSPSWQLLDPAHLSFLPYLFILSTVHLPMFAVMYEAYERHAHSTLVVTSTSGLAPFVASSATSSSSSTGATSSSSSSSASIGMGLSSSNKRDEDSNDVEHQQHSAASISDRSSSGAFQTTPLRSYGASIPSWYRRVAWAYLLVLVALLYDSWAQVWLWSSLVLIGLMSGRGINALGVWSHITECVYHQSLQRRSFATGVYVVAFTMPLAFVALTEWWLPDLEFSTTGVLLIYVAAPLVAVIAPTHWRPLPRALPRLWCNAPFIAMCLVVLGCVLVTAMPSWIPKFSTYDERVPGMLGAVISKRRMFALLFMFYGHSAFFLAGFLWTLQAPHYPSLPENNALFALFVCLMFVLWTNSVTGNISPDFLFVTAGYVSYHDRRKRIFYHLGSWVYCFACIAYLKRYADHPFDGPSWDRRLMRLLSDLTFGVILCHPLWTYVGACFINSIPALHAANFEGKVLALTAFAYVLSALWVVVIARIPFARRMLGIKYL